MLAWSLKWTLRVEILERNCGFENYDDNEGIMIWVGAEMVDCRPKMM